MPRLRHSVRVLLLDEADRVLLFCGQDPATGAQFWFPPGGGVEAGEDERAAARRELAEETGLREIQLGPEIWHRRHVFTWRGTEWDQRERWFMARTSHFEPADGRLTDAEREDLKGWRWWRLDELEATDDDLVPRDLAARLRGLLADGPPSRPTSIGT